MKIEKSKAWELSLRDYKKIILLILSFVAGFYFANTELVNAFIGQYVKPEHVGIATAFIYYFFKTLAKDNTKQ